MLKSKVGPLDKCLGTINRVIFKGEGITGVMVDLRRERNKTPPFVGSLETHLRKKLCKV